MEQSIQTLKLSYLFKVWIFSSIFYCSIFLVYTVWTFKLYTPSVDNVNRQANIPLKIIGLLMQLTQLFHFFEHSMARVKVFNKVRVRASFYYFFLTFFMPVFYTLLSHSVCSDCSICSVTCQGEPSKFAHINSENYFLYVQKNLIIYLLVNIVNDVLLGSWFEWQ